MNTNLLSSLLPTHHHHHYGSEGSTDDPDQSGGIYQQWPYDNGLNAAGTATTTNGYVILAPGGDIQYIQPQQHHLQQQEGGRAEAEAERVPKSLAGAAALNSIHLGTHRLQLVTDGMDDHAASGVYGEYADDLGDYQVCSWVG